MSASAFEILFVSSFLEERAAISVLASRVAPLLAFTVLLAQVHTSLDASFNAVNGLDLRSHPFLVVTEVFASLLLGKGGCHEEGEQDAGQEKLEGETHREGKID